MSDRNKENLVSANPSGSPDEISKELLADNSAIQPAPSRRQEGFFAARRRLRESQRAAKNAQGLPNTERLNPDRVQAESPSSPKRKALSLIDKVYNWDNLVLAWRRVRKNKGAHGLDRVTIKAFQADWQIHLREIQRKLIERRFTPTPVLRVFIPKPNDPTKLRPLGIPIVTDRVVQQAIIQIVEPLFDDLMSPRSFGYRKNRSAHNAIATLIQDAKDGFRFVVDADISAFFDQLSHELVMSRLRDRIVDGRVLGLLEAFLKAGVSQDGVVTVATKGTPQGGVVSPWISNLVLDDLDKAIEAKGWRHVRYADDFVVACRSPKEAEQALQYVKEVLGSLKLSLNETKTRLTNFNEGFEFLGFRFRCYHLGIGAKAINRFKERVRSITRRQQGRNVDAVIAELNAVLRGWARYFGVAEVTETMARLDQWVRMRIRAFRLKRKCHHDNWRLPNRRLQKWGLLSLPECRPKLRISYAYALPRERVWSLATRQPHGVAQRANCAC